MMDQPFLPEDALPPQEVRIVELRAEPWPDQPQRVRVHLEVTPFRERPNMQVTLQDMAGLEVASVHIIESIETRMTFTLHKKDGPIGGQYTLSARVFYPDLGDVDHTSIDVAIAPPA